MPSDLTVAKATSSQFDCDFEGSAVTCTKPKMNVGATDKVKISVTVPASAPDGTVDNVGTVESNTPDPDLTNNSDDASVDVVAQAAPTTTLPPVTLPKTGSDATGSIVQAAFLLLLPGGVTVLDTRRRDEELDAAG